MQAHEVRNGGGAYSAYRDDEFVDETRRQWTITSVLMSYTRA